MNKVTKALIILLLVCGFFFYISSFYTDSIEKSDNTIIISVCTGDMRTLETGISVYSGYNQMPLILSDKTLPVQLEKWLPKYIKENNITRIITAGQVSPSQKYEFLKMGVDVQEVGGSTIPEILTKLAENTNDKNNDSIILTASDPLAGYYGAYTKTPVFTTATNSTYNSSETLDEIYVNYIKKHNIKNVTIIGPVPDSIREELHSLNVTVEEITGEDSLALSDNVNSKLRQKGLIGNTSTAYYGFYGEIPTMIPLIIKDNAILLEDSSNTQDVIPLVDKYDIKTVFVTRNREADYIQMEETDYISSNIIRTLEENNITINYMTNPRTLDEATGLYDAKIITSEYLENRTRNNTYNFSGTIIKSKAPLIDLLDKREVTDSNNVTAKVSVINSTSVMLKWDTLHPYIWTKIDENNYIVESGTPYEYHWTYKNNSWSVQYKYNNTTYYNVTWKENYDNTWTEIHANDNFTWKYDGNTWICHNQKNQPVYTITTKK